MMRYEKGKRIKIFEEKNNRQEIKRRDKTKKFLCYRTLIKKIYDYLLFEILFIPFFIFRKSKGEPKKRVHKSI